MMGVPNWLRIALLFLTLASFLPQLRLLWTRRDSSGLSLFYVLINLIIATQLFTLTFFYVVNCRFEKLPFFVHNPPNFGDTLNWVQCALIWVLWLLIFVSCFVYPSQNSSLRSRSVALVVYLSFLCISVVPVFFDFATTGPYGKFGHWWDLAIFGGTHMFVVNPILTFFGITAIYAQDRATAARPPGSGPGALSLGSLGAQAIVFGLLALSWFGRLVIPWEDLGKGGEWGRGFIEVCILIGFLPFGHAAFATAQYIVLWLAVGHARRVSAPGTPPSETQPLLAG